MAGISWLDLVLWTGAVYGLGWVVARSSLLRPVRERTAPVPFLGKLVACVVCVSAWAAAGLMLVLPGTTLFTPEFRVRNPADAIVLLAFSVAATWALARALGDAD